MTKSATIEDMARDGDLGELAGCDERENDPIKVARYQRGIVVCCTKCGQARIVFDRTGTYDDILQLGKDMAGTWRTRYWRCRIARRRA